MAVTRKPTATQSAKGKSSSSSPDAAVTKTSTVYKDFSRWQSTKKPKWHPVKMMRYVFWRMISGITAQDAIRELHWHEAEFWHLVDLKRHAPFRVEYQRAKTLQARAMADSVITIAEGRDAITRKHLRQTKRIIQKALRRISRQKSALAGKAILEAALGDLRERDKIVMTRNKLQIDAAKWHAGTASPGEFGPKSSVTLGGQPDGDGTTGAPRPIAVQFVGPDGKVVAL